MERQPHLTEEKINLSTGVQHTKEEDQSGLAGNQQAENMDSEEVEEAEEKTEFGHEEPVGPDANDQTDFEDGDGSDSDRSDSDNEDRSDSNKEDRSDSNNDEDRSDSDNDEDNDGDSMGPSLQFLDMESFGMKKTRTVFMCPNEASVEQDLRSNNSVAGFVTEEHDEIGNSKHVMHVVCRLPGKRFKRRTLFFEERSNEYFHGMWHAKLKLQSPEDSKEIPVLWRTSSPLSNLLRLQHP